MSPSSRLLATVLALSLSAAGFPKPALSAPLITTEEVATRLGSTRVQEARSRLAGALQREELVQALAERGVTPEQTRARVAALTDAQVLQLVAEIDRLPAGASELVGSLVLIFVVLVFTDILGYTDLFTFVHKAP